MADYNFQTLNDREFEKLTRDLLQKELQVTLESFKPGRDGGIDLRYVSPKEDNKIIIQAKHRTRSKFEDLFNHLKKEELKKVKKLKPSRYLLVTSTEFNPDQKEKILKLFSPYIISPGDIFGKDDVNGLLGKFPEIETEHPKLWLSSVSVLRKIINNGAKGRSDFTKENITRNISLYVANRKYLESLEILNKEQFLVIVGEPGIGKTVLAKMLIYQALGDDYRLVSITEKISEAEDLWDNDQKQVFYFDDFLGANYFEIIQNRNTNSALINFIHRIKSDPTKKLILTSRTTILNQALQIYTKLEEPMIHMAKHQINIEDYSKLDKAKILYNHLYFLGLGEEYWSKIIENKNYWKIINHKNYNPRLIEFISNPFRLKGIKPKDYIVFINDSLDNPSEVWRHAYENQIDDYCKFLLQTLFSLGARVKETVFKKAFEARLTYEIKNNGFKRETEVFMLRIKQLSDGFLRTNRDSDTLYFDFFNPSIVDFLLNTLSQNDGEKWRILESVIYTTQLNERFSNLKDHSFLFLDKESKKKSNYISFLPEEIPRLHALLLNVEKNLLHVEGGSPEIDLIDFYYFNFSMEYNDSDFERLVRNIDFNTTLPTQAETLLLGLEKMVSFDKARKIIKFRWREILNYLFNSSSDRYEFEAIYKLFKEYNEEYNKYIEDENSMTIVENALNRYWKSQIRDIENGGEYSEELGDAEEVKDYISDIYTEGKDFNNLFGFRKLKIMDELNNIDPDGVLEQIETRNSYNDELYDYHKEDYYEESREDEEIKKEINNLFQ